MILALILSIFIVLIFWYKYSLYKLRTLSKQAKNIWKEVDELLDSRFSLICRVIDSYGRLSIEEQADFNEIMAARERSLGANSIEEKAVHENKISVLSSSMRSLVVGVRDIDDESYNKNTRDELSRIEVRLNGLVNFYNDTAQDLNRLTNSFPSNIIAHAYNYGEIGVFDI